MTMKINGNDFDLLLLVQDDEGCSHTGSLWTFLYIFSEERTILDTLSVFVSTSVTRRGHLYIEGSS